MVKSGLTVRVQRRRPIDRESYWADSSHQNSPDLGAAKRRPLQQAMLASGHSRPEKLPRFGQFLTNRRCGAPHPATAKSAIGSGEPMHFPSNAGLGRAWGAFQSSVAAVATQRAVRAAHVRLPRLGCTSYDTWRAERGAMGPASTILPTAHG
jgi:hypothetical protein